MMEARISCENVRILFQCSIAMHCNGVQCANAMLQFILLLSHNRVYPRSFLAVAKSSLWNIPAKLLLLACPCPVSRLTDSVEWSLKGFACSWYSSIRILKLFWRGFLCLILNFQVITWCKSCPPFPSQIALHWWKSEILTYSSLTELGCFPKWVTGTKSRPVDDDWMKQGNPE